MKEIITLLQRLNENFGDILGRDESYLSDRVAAIVRLAEAELAARSKGSCGIRGETNSERVKRIIAARHDNFSI